MAGIDPQEFGELKATVDMLRGTVEKMDRTVDDIRDQLAEAKGGWKVLLAIGGASATVASAATWAMTHLQQWFGKGPPA